MCEVPSRPRPHRPLPEPGWYMSVQRELNCLSSSLWSVLGQVGLKLAHAGLNQAQVGHTKRFLLKISALVGILESRVLIVIDPKSKFDVNLQVYFKLAIKYQKHKGSFRTSQQNPQRFAKFEHKSQQSAQFEHKSPHSAQFEHDSPNSAQFEHKSPHSAQFEHNLLHFAQLVQLSAPVNRWLNFKR